MSRAQRAIACRILAIFKCLALSGMFSPGGSEKYEEMSASNAEFVSQYGRMLTGGRFRAASLLFPRHYRTHNSQVPHIRSDIYIGSVLEL